MKILFKSAALLFLFCLTFTVKTESVDAASLSNASDTITTSRPSASTPLSANVAPGDAQAIVYNNGSIFLASDSATLQGQTSETLTVSSMSAAQTTVFFTGTAANAHANGTVLYTPITAMHTIAFKTIQSIPGSGTIVLTFPSSSASDTNQASPSASTFMMNGLSTTNIKVNNAVCTSVTVTGTAAGSAPTITCTLNGTAVPGGTVVTFLLGCSLASGAACTTQVPTIINPTKSAAAGNADIWSVKVQTNNNSSVPLDNINLKIGTVESVFVQATVDTTFTFTIGGTPNGSAVNTGNTTGCTETETTNSGITSTATAVNLGTLNNTPGSINTKVSNLAGQLITITTNGKFGYALTATSSGHLINPSNGYYIQDSTTPAVFPNNTPWFGIHACGLDVTAATWSTTTQACNTYITGSTDPICKYGWPTSTGAGAITLASTASGPIGNSVTAGSGLVSVAYAAGVSPVVPAGTYNTVITYVATPTF